MAATANPYQNKHPQYVRAAPDWQIVRDTFDGQRAVKAGGASYLPVTSGMRAAGMETAESEGSKMYAAYKLRAVFPEIVSMTANELVGLLHRAPPEIKLPAKLEPLRAYATPNNESLEALLRRINLEQLLTGRIGLLLDVEARTDLPYLATYNAEHILNWDDEPSADQVKRVINYIVLDESGPRRSGPDWLEVCEQRVLQLSAGTGGVFQTVQVKDGAAAPPITPSLMGKTLTRIPFVIVSATDIDPRVGQMPLLGLSNTALAIYRGDADYRHTLFMTGQDTLVIIGADVPSGPGEGEGAAAPTSLIGAGAVIALTDKDADAKFIGIEGAGLEHQAKALEALDKRASEYGARLLAAGRAAESGDALQIRVASRTATLTTIARAGALALEEALAIAAEWVGANPDEVEVIPNLDFTEDVMGAEEFASLVASRMQGLPLSLKSIHELLRKREMTTMEYDDEVELIEKEGAGPLGLMATPAGAVDNPNPREPATE